MECVRAMSLLPVHDSSHPVAVPIIMPYTNAMGDKNRINPRYWISREDRSFLVKIGLMPMYDSSYLVAASVIMPYTDATGNKNRINFGYWIFDKDIALFLQVSFKFSFKLFSLSCPHILWNVRHTNCWYHAFLAEKDRFHRSIFREKKLVIFGKTGDFRKRLFVRLCL